MQPKQVVTFLGYSGQGYQNIQEILQYARNVLSQFDPKKTIVNIGVSRIGVGEIYGLAKEMNFETTGILSSKGVKYLDDIKHVDKYFITRNAMSNHQMALDKAKEIFKNKTPVVFSGASQKRFSKDHIREPYHKNL